MSSIDWPSGLPAARVGSLKEKPRPRFSSDPATVGADRRRARYTRTLMSYTFKLRMNAVQADLLREFRDITTSGGVLRFNWTHYVTGKTYLMEFASLPDIIDFTVDVFDTTIELDEI